MEQQNSIKDIVRNFGVEPYCIESEQAVLGAILRNNTLWNEIRGCLREVVFYREDHRHIYSHLSRLLENGKPASIEHLKTAMASCEAESLEKTVSYLEELVAAAPDAAAIPDHVQIVQKRFFLRRLLEAQDEFGLCMRAKDRSGFSPLQPCLDRLAERIKLPKNTLAHECFVDGFAAMAPIASYLHPGDLIVLAARPAMGKTIFALQIAAHMAVDRELPVGIISMASTADRVVSRLLAIHSQVSLERLTRVELDQDELFRLNNAFNAQQQAPLFIDDRTGQTLAQIKSSARKLFDSCNQRLSLLVIDELRLLLPGSRSRPQRMFKTLRALKQLALDLGVPILVLTGVSRRVENRRHKGPTLADLNDRGAIERCADTVLAIWRVGYYEPENPNRDLATISILKNRHGTDGAFCLRVVTEPVFAFAEDRLPTDP